MGILFTGGVKMTGGVLLVSAAHTPPPPTPNPVPIAINLSMPVTALSVPDTGNIIYNVAWYKFTSSIVQTVVLDTIGSTGTAQAYLAVFDSASNLYTIDWNESGGNRQALLTLTNLPIDTYYVAVCVQGGGGLGITLNGTNFDISSSYAIIGQGMVLNAIVATPTVDFSATPTTGNGNASIAFTDLSTFQPTPAVSWDFGDGKQSLEQNPVHTYYATGTFGVTMALLNPYQVVYKAAYITLTSTYAGTWNASTNTPSLANGTGTFGDQYLVSVPGTVTFGIPVTFAVGDYITYNGSYWAKSPAGTKNGNINNTGPIAGSDVQTIVDTPAYTTKGRQLITTSSGSYTQGGSTITFNSGDYITCNGTIWQVTPYYAAGLGQPFIFTVDTTLGTAGLTAVFPIMAGYGTLDWGDGSTAVGAQGNAPSHTYSSNGTYTVKFWATGLDNYKIDASVSDITNWTGVSSFGTIGLTDANYLFYNATNVTSVPATLPASVRTMHGMFELSAPSGTFNPDVSGWDTSLVTDMSSMFMYMPGFNRDLSTWNTSNVTSMADMFFGATTFNGNVSTWNTVNVTTMGAMFRDCTAFNQNISSWNVANVNDMNFMFKDATSFNQNISGWNLNATITNGSITGFLWGASSFSQNLSGINTYGSTYPANFATGTPIAPTFPGGVPTAPNLPAAWFPWS